jgi:ATP-dependent 26S proteasome regulatory subunit
VLKQRSGAGDSHAEDNKVVHEFLNHLETTDEHNIVFIGATNRVDSIDSAGMRAGRIDKKIKIGKPDKRTREVVLRVQLAGRSHKLPDELISTIAAETHGCVPAELERLVRAAGKQALQRGDDIIKQGDIDEAMSTICKQPQLVELISKKENKTPS